ncbi:Protein kinase superfamily protein [Perilla frutescens var. hirtella]|uniref:Protein kinase superfamily protein n=1 Tax=Perilla frutescens var. hirtella TaxID=608512 RepID=A0AAD4IZV5_PERFH|nr:Protein kinase superfamily protein [Perilla frutescens var. hirtella]
MSLFILLHLLTLLPANFGTPSQPIYLSLSWLPTLPSLARMNSPKHANIASMGTSFNQFIDFRRRHFQYLPAAPAQSPASKGPLSSHTGSRHHHHRHRIRNHAVSPSPSTTPDCGQTCPKPLTSAPFGSPCGCVIPLSVRLLLGVSVYAIFPEVNELEIEVAAGTYLKQSQVSIVGANADDENQDKTIVDINLVPLGEKFDNTTATLIYQRLLQKKVHLNRTLFGDYDVMYISYPGLPPSCPPGEGPSGGTGNQQDPIIANVGDKNKKMNLKIISVIALSTLVLLVVCFAAIAIILNCLTSRIPSNAVESVFTSSINKRHGIESKLSNSPASSTSASLISAIPAFVLSVKTFSLAEVEKATEKFSPKKLLGEGGFGRVYHGIMDDGTEVAVKLLKRGDNHNGDRQFIAEIEMLSRLHHRNLVKLIGMCFEKQTRCLVYELVPNGSVESHLHGADRSKGPLDWDARLKIALGAARGLAYLHEDSNPHVIHRDFKASNVLIENDFSPKVSDFGLAREATEGSHHISTQVMGTFGYVAPEYAMTGHLLVKSDVYSYGVVLLELLSGRKPVDMSQHPGQENLVTWARPLLTNREGLEQLVDPSLSGSYDFDDMAKVAAIASMCVHPEVTHRPFMGEVVQALKLIYNDIDETCGDAYSQKGSSTHYSDIKGNFAPSDSSWWNAGGTPPRLTYGQASSYITMECSSGSPYELQNRPGFGALPTRHSNRLGSSRIIETNRAFYRLLGSMSDHGALLAKRAAMDIRGHAASF